MAQVNTIQNNLFTLIKVIDNIPKKDAKQTEMLYNLRDIVELILYFNNEDQNQEGSSLKILTPNQMLSRLPISLAQLKTDNAIRNKTTIVLFARIKIFTKNIYKSLIDII